jgi:phosphate-selective porin
MNFGKLAAGACLVGILAVGAGAEEQRTADPGGVLDKPHLRRGGKGTAIGGYIDQELFWNDKSKTFTQHRFIPFLHGQVSDRIQVMAEIEFEYGGLVKGRGETDGEVKLEFATVDLNFSEGVNYRAGLILSPLGRFNLQHDSPLNDLTNRPLVDREIIPTTLAETGMGFYGAFYPGEKSLLGYELYVVNGFNAATATSIRNGRGSHKTDNNEQKALVGRVNYSPILGLDLGVSAHRGAYDDAGDQALTILALDADCNRGPLQLKGEYARASVEEAAADQQWGYYAQAAYHFLPGAVRAFPNSVFTGVFRYDAIDLETRDEKRYTLGVNFRPEEDTALKLEYEVYDQDDQSNGIVFSVASYF